MPLFPPAPDRPSDTVVQPSLVERIVGDQRVAFVVVGLANTAIGLGCFALLHLLFRQQLHYLVLLTITYAVAISCAFVLHRRFVFRVRGQVWLDYVRFWLVNLATLVVNAVLLAVAVEQVGAPVLPAQVVVLGVTVMLSFVGHSLFSFRR